ncbi:MAG TPA: hypothetical protein DCY88_22715 [Cyanobacteria bacterium UBA11372]|nr:hypothetical protein [Cyanobacteria bacterium UBA11372]
MSKQYFILWYRLDGVNAYLIWYTNDCDGVLVDSGKVICFKSISLLRRYAEGCGLYIEEEEPIFQELDPVKNWLYNPSKTEINCNIFLSVWNLFIDIASSVQDVAFDRDRDKTDIVYEKLFWGNNLPSVTPRGQHYTPTWTDDEVETLQEVLAYGLNMFLRSAIALDGLP